MTIEHSPELTDKDLNNLFHAAWPQHRDRSFQKVLGKSLAYFAVRPEGTLVGFVNLAWDGGLHGFVLDTTVHPGHRRKGLGLALLKEAVKAAEQAGLEWLHVDFEPELEAFYRKAGFGGTAAGLMRLKRQG